MSLLKQLLTETDSAFKLFRLEDDPDQCLDPNFDDSTVSSNPDDTVSDPNTNITIDDIPVSDEAKQLVNKFAKWLVDNGDNINKTSSKLDIYNDDTRLTTPVILQDEESIKSNELDQQSSNIEELSDIAPQDPTTSSEDDMMLTTSQDPNRQGSIRTVPNAHLVYKRKDEAGTFEELWIFNIDRTSLKTINTKKEILAGTDIDPGATQSPDGIQQYSSWIIGNATLLKITGLPN